MKTAPDNFVQTLKELGLGSSWEWKNGSWWKTPKKMDVRATTTRMISLDARFVAITATEQPDKEIRLDYQWDLNGQLLSFVTATAAQRVPSITDLCPAADWVERETREYFAVEFTGREDTKPLMTRAGDPIGINLHKEVAK
jgi:NADH-quinone oxidoreductase subunit C